MKATKQCTYPYRRRARKKQTSIRNLTTDLCRENSLKANKSEERNKGEKGR